MITFSPKVVISPLKYVYPKMVNYALFLLNCRELLVHAFRKKDPLKPKGGTESVHRNLNFFRDGFP